MIRNFALAACIMALYCVMVWSLHVWALGPVS
jgi:hypothetical protein